MQRMPLVTNVLKANEEAARANRALFDRQPLLAVNLMSAPGAGKTSVLEQTIRRLGGRYRLAVIEGDLQTTIDRDRILALGVASHQITTGSVCHLDARMVARALAEFPIDGLRVLFIENVGNLVCPAEYNLGEHLRAMVYSVVEGAEKPKKYPLMFHTSDVVILNKIDLAPYAGVELEELRRNVLAVNPHAAIFPLSCRTGEGLEAWVRWLGNRIEQHCEH
jgi:hydrogenase nickel incorporation protein HypB